LLIKHLEKVAHTQSDDVQIPPGEDSEYSFGKWMDKSSYARLLLLNAKGERRTGCLGAYSCGTSETADQVAEVK
jgi:hypothetical protein